MTRNYHYIIILSFVSWLTDLGLNIYSIDSYWSVTPFMRISYDLWIIVGISTEKVRPLPLIAANKFFHHSRENYISQGLDVPLIQTDKIQISYMYCIWKNSNNFGPWFVHLATVQLWRTLEKVVVRVRALRIYTPSV